MATFTDTFNRTDSTNLGANWVEVSGDWSIVSNQLSSGSAGGTIILRAAGAMDTNDNSAQATIAATAAVSHGVWCRGNSNITSGYLWRNDGSSWDLFSVVGGSFSVIGTYAVAASPGDVAKVQAVGPTIKGFVNGVERVSVTDTNVPTGTSVGIRAESVATLRFDDFTAADVTSGVTGDAAYSGTATLSASGLRATAGTSALDATATLTAGGLRAASSDAVLTASAGLTADGAREAQADAGLTASALFTSQGQVDHSGTTTLTATAELTADGVAAPPPVLGAAALNAASILTATGHRAASTGSALTASAALTTAGVTAAAGASAITVTAALTASGTLLSTHDDVDVTVGAPYSPWTVADPHDSGWKVGAPW